MKKWCYLILLCLLASCATQRVPTENKHFHTAEAKRATLTLTLDGKKLSVGATLQTVRDSVVIVSIQPIAGIEIAYLKATHKKIFAAERINKQYIELTYREINLYLQPNLTFKALQQLATDENPDNRQKTYKAGRHTISIKTDIPTQRFDTPLRLRESRAESYQKADIKQLITNLKK